MRLAYPFRWPSEYLGVRDAWSAHRWAWTFLGLLGALIAVLSLVGPVLVGERNQAGDGSLQVTYPGLQRTGSRAVFALVPRESQAAQGGAVLCLGTDFLQAWQVEAVEPQPASQTRLPGGLCLSLHLRPDAEDSPALHLLVRPRHAALPARGTVWMAGNVPVTVSAWVLP